MRSSIFLVVIALSCFIFAQASIPTENSVLLLNDENFEQALKDHENIMVYFYIETGCETCDKINEFYHKVAEQLIANNRSAAMGKINVHQNPITAHRQQITYAPVLRMFFRGDELIYDAPIAENYLYNFIETKAVRQLIKVVNHWTFGQIIANRDHVVVFWADKNISTFRELEFLPKYHVDPLFCYFPNDDENITYIMKEQLGVPLNSTVSFIVRWGHKGPDMKAEGVDIDLTYNSVQNWFKSQYLPSVKDYDKKYSSLAFTDIVPLYFLFTTKELSETREGGSSPFSDASNILGRDLQFFRAFIEDSFGGPLADFLGVTRNDIPTVRVVFPRRSDFRKFKPAQKLENFTSSELVDFWNDIKDGKVKPYKISDPVPTEQHGNVHVLVGETFLDYVQDGSKDVLVFFTGKECEACKLIENDFANVADKLSGVKDLSFASFDLLHNEQRIADVIHLPTFVYFSKDDKKPVIIKDVTSGDDLVSWLGQHTRHVVVETMEL